MQVLIDASLPRAVREALDRHSIPCSDVRDIGLREAPDPVIAAHAQQHGFIILSADFDFADVRIYPPAEYAGIVIIERPLDPTITETVAIVDLVFSNREVTRHLAGRLAIASSSRIRIRPSLPESPNPPTP
jgi:hypothetical protein